MQYKLTENKGPKNTKAENILEMYRKAKLFNRLKLSTPLEGPCVGGTYRADGSFWLKPALP